MPRKLKPDERALLCDVLQQWAPHRPELIDRIDRNVLSAIERREVCEFITNELMTSGLDPSDEPTPRGLRLEALIDAVNRPNLKPNDN
jgi:hypothetical protein